MPYSLKLGAYIYMCVCVMLSYAHEGHDTDNKFSLHFLSTFQPSCASV